MAQLLKNEEFLVSNLPPKISQLNVTLLFLILAVAVLPGCLSTGNGHPIEAIASLQAIEIPRGHAAVQSVSRIDPKETGNWWEKRYETLNDRSSIGGHEMVFIGDSITHSWENAGKDIWNEFYGDRKALNLGISGDRTEHVLWRLENGNIDGLTPKLAVIMIGTNNYRDNSAEEIGEGIISIVKHLNREMPEMNVLILGIFPRFKGPHPKRRMLAEASAIASSIADGKRIHYLDIGTAFLEDDGKLPKDIMPDFLHPNERGYRIWAEAIEPKVAELLGE